MSSYAVTASVGGTVIGKDVLFPTSHPKVSVAWSRNPAYAAMTTVPLKTGVLDAFRKNADAINAESDIARQVEELERDLTSQKEALKAFDASFRTSLSS